VIGIIPISVRLWTKKAKFNDDDSEMKGRDLLGKADIVTLGTVLNTGLISVAKQIVKLIPKRIPLLQCENCLRYGHRKCSRDQRCNACGRAGHTQGSEECDKIITCRNCGKGHKADDRTCLHRKRELDIITKIRKESIPRSQAIQQAFAKAPDRNSNTEFPNLNRNQEQIKKSTTRDCTYAQATGGLLTKELEEVKSQNQYQTETLAETMAEMKLELEKNMKESMKVILKENAKMMQETFQTMFKQLKQHIALMIQQSLSQFSMQNIQPLTSQYQTHNTQIPMFDAQHYYRMPVHQTWSGNIDNNTGMSGMETDIHSETTAAQEHNRENNSLRPGGNVKTSKTNQNGS
jgi:hypothetical protein